MPARALLLFDPGLFSEALQGIVAECCPGVVFMDAGDAETGAPDLVLVDADRQSGEPEALLGPLRQRHPDAAFVVLGQDDSAGVAAEWSALGASAYVPKHYGRAAMLAVFRLVHTSRSDRQSADQPAIAAVRSRDGSLEAFGMTPREIDVLSQAALGKTNLEIGQSLGITEGTVRVQMTSILAKLGVRNRSEAILIALRSASVAQRHVDLARGGQLQLDWLLPHMDHRRAAAGSVLFRKGDPGTEMFYLQRGTVRLPEIGVEMTEREVFGEIGVFHPDRRRTCSAVCTTDVDLFTLSDQKVRQMYFLNPGFAFFVLNLLTTRLTADTQRVFRDAG